MSRRFPLLLLVLLIALGANTSLTALAESGEQNQVHLEIVGQLLDEAGDPLAAEPVTLLIGLAASGWDVEEDLTTDRQGQFRLQMDLRQESFFNAGRPCVVVQAAIQLADHVQLVEYLPGDPAEASEPGFTERWLNEGTHKGDYHILFYHLRRGEANAEEADFDDLTIRLGSRESPSQFQVERKFTITEYYLDEEGEDLQPAESRSGAGRSMFTGDPPALIEQGETVYQYVGWSRDDEEQRHQEEPTLEITGDHQLRYHYRPTEEVAVMALQILHLWAEDKETLAPLEEYEILSGQATEFASQPLSIAAMAPLRAVLSRSQAEETPGTAEVMLQEAQRGSPIETVTLPIQPGQWVLTYYYHWDRDDDGVPDFAVQERFLEIDGSPLTELAETIVYYANGDLYQGTPPQPAGYQYLGYQDRNIDDGENNREALLAGMPQYKVTTDLQIAYIYEKESDSGGGRPGGNQDKDKGGGGSPGPDNPGEGSDLDGETPAENDAETDDEEAGQNPNEELADELPVEQEPSAEPQQSAEPSAALAGEPVNVQTELPAPVETESAGTLSETEREALRNVTFVKRGHRQQAEPGEEVSYSFTGFENAFPYPLTEFTIIDQPDPGLDFVSMSLPAFQKGEGISYQVKYSTNHQSEQLLVVGHPAGQSLLVTAPTLSPGEYLTEIYVYLEEAPAGFGVGDAIDVSFRIWEEPPAEELHNKGILFYREQGEPITSQSEDTEPTLQIASLFSSWGDPTSPTGTEMAGLLTGKGNGHDTAWLVSIFLVLLGAGAIVVSRNAHNRRKV